ncbi:MAG: 1-acyl-sn-glycerol-3-phosphate acyltransferase [Steroidobacteraceae bacterium]|jgi:1-acyl-sn-glycerol-3-phosphate acyltransferase|nr:1-acyl-sn-glycerol-3-phosphate acyltransferase [Steroidobacteraceae bacterium]
MQMTTPQAGVRTSLLQRFAAAALRAFGWRSVFVPPPAPKGIIVVYPHTSNWDFIVGVLFKFAAGLPAHWMGKDSLFRWPLRRLFIRMGGIPINRRERTGFVATLLEEFARQEWMWLAVAPEGTRSRTDHWKSGFYQIAVAGGLPVGLGFIDYATRSVGIGAYLEMTGDAEADFARIRAFYTDKRGRRPDQESDIRLKPPRTPPP